MEECRFETSELQASLMMSTSIWSDSWSLCNAANSVGSMQIKRIAGGIVYVALPTVQLEKNLVGLEEVAGDEIFSGGLTVSLDSDEPPVMVDSCILKLFVSNQSQIKEGLKLEGAKKVVITGYSTGGTIAALTALCLLSQPLPPPYRLLCITFGSPLLGNQSLSSLITQSRLSQNFCHVISVHDTVPRSKGDEFWPFGTYLFCSDNGGVCIDNADSVLRMFRILNGTTTTRRTTTMGQEHYEHYVSTLSHQFLKSRSFLGESISENSYEAGVALAVESLGFSNDEPSGVAAKECIETATIMVRTPVVRSAELANELGNVLPSRLEIQWYKERCDASREQLGYYDFFKKYSNQRNIKVNMSRAKLAKFWDKVFEMVENNELPFDFHLALGKKWVYASQFYRLLAEPLDIAYFYKYAYSKTSGHYLETRNRPKRYQLMDKWWKVSGDQPGDNPTRTKYASTTQDTCFWAKLEEAKECLDEMRKESNKDAQRRSLLWEKIVGFESYADTLVKKMEVSSDVLAKNSSYSVWVQDLREFKSTMGNGTEMVLDEIDAMET